MTISSIIDCANASTDKCVLTYMRILCDGVVMASLTKIEKDYIAGRMSWIRSQMDIAVKMIERMNLVMKELEDKLEAKIKAPSKEIVR